MDVAAQGVDGAEREGRFGDALGENVEAARAARVERETAAELGVFVEDWRVRERGDKERTELALLGAHGIGDGDVAGAAAVGGQREPDDLADGDDDELLAPAADERVGGFLEEHAAFQDFRALLEAHRR